MKKKSVVVASLLGAVVLVGGSIFALTRSPQSSANTPAQDVSLLTPEGAKNVRLFQANLKGDGVAENIVIYDQGEGDAEKRVLEVLEHADTGWNVVAQSSIPAKIKFEGIQRVDFGSNGKQEFFVLLNNQESKESAYIVLAYEQDSYQFYKQPAIGDASVGDVIELQEGETRAQFASFKATPDGIAEVYGVYCEDSQHVMVPSADGQGPEEEVAVPCRAALFQVTYNEGQFHRTFVKSEDAPEIVPAPAQ